MDKDTEWLRGTKEKMGREWSTEQLHENKEGEQKLLYETWSQFPQQRKKDPNMVKMKLLQIQLIIQAAYFWNHIFKCKHSLSSWLICSCNLKHFLHTELNDAIKKKKIARSLSAFSTNISLCAIYVNLPCLKECMCVWCVWCVWVRVSGERAHECVTARRHKRAGHSDHFLNWDKSAYVWIHVY